MHPCGEHRTWRSGDWLLRRLWYRAYQYSCLGHIAADAMAERITSKGFPELLEGLITDPLHLSSVTYGPVEPAHALGSRSPTLGQPRHASRGSARRTALVPQRPGRQRRARRHRSTSSLSALLTVRPDRANGRTCMSAHVMSSGTLTHEPQARCLVRIETHPVAFARPPARRAPCGIRVNQGVTEAYEMQPTRLVCRRNAKV